MIFQMLIDSILSTVIALPTSIRFLT